MRTCFSVTTLKQKAKSGLKRREGCSEYLNVSLDKDESDKLKNTNAVYKIDS